MAQVYCQILHAQLLLLGQYASHGFCRPVVKRLLLLGGDGSHVFQPLLQLDGRRGYALVEPPLYVHVPRKLVGGASWQGGVHEPCQVEMVLGGILVASLVDDGLAQERYFLGVVREELGKFGVEITVVMAHEQPLVGVHGLVGYVPRDCASAPNGAGFPCNRATSERPP